MFTLRPLNESDYDTILLGWWADWGWVAPMKDMLPQDGVGGVIVYDEDEPVCAGFLYMTNSKMAWVEWVISNKNYRKKPQRKEAVVYLIKTLTDIAKNNGAKFAYTVVKNKSLSAIYAQIGYIDGDNNIKEMIKSL
jgi:hypothetical protein